MSSRPHTHPVLLLVSAPSGAGKTTLCQKLLTNHEELKYSISCTTRSPRPGEVDGTHYHFLSRDVFEQRIERGEFLEHADVYGNYYGTLTESVERVLEKGDNVLMDVDVQGAALIRGTLARRNKDDLLVKSFVDVFVSPPSLEELHQRLVSRASDASDVIERRMQQAVAEMEHRCEYAYAIVNDDLAVAERMMECIYQASRCRS